MDERSPLLALGYLYYNVPLLELVNERNSKLAVGVIDNVVHLVKGGYFKEMHCKIKNMFMQQGGASLGPEHTVQNSK
jgi:hypothetical protein